MAPDRHTPPPVRLNERFSGYRCVVCGKPQSRDFADYVCPDCGVDGILDVEYDRTGLRADLKAIPSGLNFPANPAGGMWMFAPLLPVCPTAPHPAWTLGLTPLHAAPRLASAMGVGGIWLKDDTGLPSASLKDRASAVAVAHAICTGREHLACASTGNAAASLAVMSARAGLPCHIFLPAAAPQAKLAQLLIHQADVVRVNGTYDQAFDLSLEQISANNWYSRNCAHNPLLVEGKKTAALEIAGDLTAGFTREPDAWPEAVLVPVGDGCIVSSVAKAMVELKWLGLIPAVPRIIGVQAAGAAPLAAAWSRCTSHADMDGRAILAAVAPVEPHTLADSISVGIPRNRVKAWKYVAATGGAFIAAEDSDITRAIRILGAKAGVFAEPSGAAALAGVGPALRAGLIGPESVIAVMVTGHGLKDPAAALKGVSLPDPIPPLA